MKRGILVVASLLLASLMPAYASGTHGSGHSADMPKEGHMMEDKVYIKGKVEEVDPDTKNITIAHGPLVNLNMDAMTMVFKAANDEVFAKLVPGAEIEFVVERINGKLTVMDVK